MSVVAEQVLLQNFERTTGNFVAVAVGRFGKIGDRAFAERTKLVCCELSIAKFVRVELLDQLFDNP